MDRIFSPRTFLAAVSQGLLFKGNPPKVVAWGVGLEREVLGLEMDKDPRMIKGDDVHEDPGLDKIMHVKMCGLQDLTFGILVPDQRIEYLQWKHSLNHWTNGEFPVKMLLCCKSI